MKMSSSLCWLQLGCMKVALESSRGQTAYCVSLAQRMTIKSSQSRSLNPSASWNLFGLHPNMKPSRPFSPHTQARSFGWRPSWDEFCKDTSPMNAAQNAQQKNIDDLKKRNSKESRKRSTQPPDRTHETPEERTFPQFSSGQSRQWNTVGGECRLSAHCAEILFAASLERPEAEIMKNFMSPS